MKRVVSLSAVQPAVRARVCACCPQRSGDTPPGRDGTRACETKCPPFRDLPRLWDLAVRLDPMVASVGRALSRAVRDTEPRSAAATRVRRDRAFVCILRDLSGK